MRSNKKKSPLSSHGQRLGEHFLWPRTTYNYLTEHVYTRKNIYTHVYVRT